MRDARGVLRISECWTWNLRGRVWVDSTVPSHWPSRNTNFEFEGKGGVAISYQWFWYYFGRGDDAVGNPHRARNSQFELFELTYLNSSFSSLSSYWIRQTSPRRAIRGKSSDSRQRYLSQQYPPSLLLCLEIILLLLLLLLLFFFFFLHIYIYTYT